MGFKRFEPGRRSFLAAAGGSPPGLALGCSPKPGEWSPRRCGGASGRSVVAHAAGVGKDGAGLRTYRDGVISVANGPARACGVAVGMAARDAARRLLEC